MLANATSWNKVAGWYDDLLAGNDTYQTKVILPNLLRVLALKKRERVLDLACGQGFFSRAFHAAGAKVIGIDSALALIERAKDLSSQEIVYKIATAERLDFLAPGSIDIVTIVLAIQNIENIAAVFDACARVLSPEGRLLLVMNHPAFRIPKVSSWGFDAANGQYRRIDEYMTERKVKIEMHPGDAEKRKSKNGKRDETTVSYHRPLQVYFKTLANAGFAVTRLEEWISHRESQDGPRKTAEDKARKEFPLFLMIEARMALNKAE